MIAIVPLKTTMAHQGHELGDLLRGLLGEDTIVRLADEGKTTIAEVAGVVVKVSLRDQPVPADLFEGPLSAAWYWPEAREILSGHEGHVIIMVDDPRLHPADNEEPASEAATEEVPTEALTSLSTANHDKPPVLDADTIRRGVQNALLLTRVTQVIGSALGAVGVYWDASTSIHAWNPFDESCVQMSPQNLPIRIWVDFRLWEAADGTRGLVTRGLSSLGQRELEVIGSSSSAEQIRAWCYTVAHYCLEKCEVLTHGQAVGISPNEWIRAWIVESRLDPGKWATWLDLEAEE